MTNKNYQKGASHERELVNEAISQGGWGTRSAGSHGTFDVIRWINNRLELIQVKSASSVPTSHLKLNDYLKKIFDTSAQLPQTITCVKILAVRQRGRPKWRFIEHVTEQND